MKSRDLLRSLLSILLAVGLTACSRADKPQLVDGPGPDSRADRTGSETVVGPGEDIFVPAEDVADTPTVPDAVPDATSPDVQPPDPDVVDVMPPDVPNDVAPADIGLPPPGCCLTDDDCTDDNDNDVFARICYEGLYGEKPFGICVLAPEEMEEGR